MKSPSVVKAKFLRSKCEASFTKVWDDFTPDERQCGFKEDSIEEGELPVMGYLPNDSYYWLLTNKRLIVKNDERHFYYLLEEIIKVEPREIFSGEKTKLESSNLYIVTKDGHFDLQIEKGTWHVIYSILKFVKG